MKKVLSILILCLIVFVLNAVDYFGLRYLKQEHSIVKGINVQNSTSLNETYLLETNWGQRNEFTRFSPDNYRLGCWSTAIAQILYFHRMRPSGFVTYESSLGYVINEDMNAYKFNWSLFVNSLNENTPEESINEVARYVYFTSVVIQKDYGTMYYMLNSSARAMKVAEHYNCFAQLDSSSSYSMLQIKEFIIQELDAQYPVMLYIRNLEQDRGHAVVVDAYNIVGSEFWVHINMGWEGVDNGWYDFDSPILDYDDTDYRLIMKIKPRILITSPNDGEEWKMGVTQNITWTINGVSNDVHIVLQQNGTNVALIAKSVDSTLGSYSWNVGDCMIGAVTPGTNYKILISEKGTPAIDKSDTIFTIKPSITVTSPNGGENWTLGTLHNITWNATGLTGTEKLYIVLQQDGTNVALISKGVDPTIGTYSWDVGDCIKGAVMAGSNYKIFLVVKGKGTKDKSNGVFTINSM